jgi:hypothetical protein
MLTLSWVCSTILTANLQRYPSYFLISTFCFDPTSTSSSHLPIYSLLHISSQTTTLSIFSHHSTHPTIPPFLTLPNLTPQPISATLFPSESFSIPIHSPFPTLYSQHNPKPCSPPPSSIHIPILYSCPASHPRLQKSISFCAISALFKQASKRVR